MLNDLPTPPLSYSTAALAKPIRVGRITLGHRLALAPLTRLRADKNHVHGDLAVEYYTQRASTPGTLLVTEGTFIADRAGGFDNVPGIWNADQVQAWKRVTDAVHARGSFIFCQLWALGRAAERSTLPAQYDIHSSGNISISEGAAPQAQMSDYIQGGNKPRPLTIEEIDEYVETYAQAARNAIEAGFDGVEVLSANGYMLDQFLQTNANNRTDAYGGSAANRIKFTTRVVRAVAAAIGVDRVGLRLSPYERFNGMYSGPLAAMETFSLIIRTLAPLGLGYLHVTEPRVSGQLQTAQDSGWGLQETIDWATAIWLGKPGAEATVTKTLQVEDLPVVDGTAAPTNVLIVAGGYTAQTAATRATDADLGGEDVVIAFGRYFISNPDLPARVLKGIPLAKYDRTTFYKRESPVGYTDYPFAE
ncbi:NADPH dehydrogenase [Auriculariales sp. MPI-PUGE-AT-0066]|nr:NADPH dehydrogenase [Auriculariales sp. MPI-PUGE-AT-0066]